MVPVRILIFLDDFEESESVEVVLRDGGHRSAEGEHLVPSVHASALQRKLLTLYRLMPKMPKLDWIQWNLPNPVAGDPKFHFWAEVEELERQVAAKWLS